MYKYMENNELSLPTHLGYSPPLLSGSSSSVLIGGWDVWISLLAVLIGAIRRQDILSSERALITVAHFSRWYVL